MCKRQGHFFWKFYLTFADFGLILKVFRRSAGLMGREHIIKLSRFIKNVFFLTKSRLLCKGVFLCKNLNINMV